MKEKPSFRNFPLNRLLTYVVIIGFLPALFTLFNVYQKKQEWRTVSEKIIALHEMSEAKARKQYLNTIVRNTYADTDQFYLENQLESLLFLRKERETLERLLQNPTFTGNEAAEKRYNLITSKANRFELMQGTPQSAEGVHETSCTLSHSVEIDTNDLKEILNRIEGNRKGKPQLLITDLKLNKKTHGNGNEVYELNLKFKKREFLHS